MVQSSFAIMTNLGRAKEAAALANATTIEITHIAIGEGVTVPSGGETALYDEVDRKTISGSGTVVGASNVAYFDAFLAAEDGPYTIRESGLIDSDGDLIAIAHYNPAINKPLPASGQTVSGNIRLEVAFSDIANVTIVVDPSMMVALQRLTVTPWIPVKSISLTAPPVAPAIGDTYVIATGATGSWDGNDGKLTEYTAAGWAMITPKDGHGVGLPDGKVYIKQGGSYVELMASNGEINAGSSPVKAVSAKELAARLRGASTTDNIPENGWDDAGNSWGLFPTLLKGDAVGGPGGTNYFHCWSLMYAGASNITQIAIPYTNSSAQAQGWLMRGRNSGVWGPWASIIGDGITAGLKRKYLGFHGDPVLISIPNNVQTRLTSFAGKENNLPGATEASGIITIGTTGYYNCTANMGVLMPAGSNYGFNVSISKVNESDVAIFSIASQTTDVSTSGLGGNQAVSATGIAKLHEGDRIAVFFRHNQGSAQNMGISLDVHFLGE